VSDDSFSILNSQFSIPTRLHLGSGPHHLDGWINIDNAPYPGVDRVVDVTTGLPFADVSLVFAEHFIEHLSYSDAENLFRECRRLLRDDGVLRLSTPNLDWVWATHYKSSMTAEEEVLACFAINRAFRGWGHQFLYNERTLASSLIDAGFSQVARCQYGESEHELLRGLERHERNKDLPGLSHILIVEASGHGKEKPPHFDDPRSMYLRDLGVK
jgi:predicted SAM-dependent methyltransferase